MLKKNSTHFHPSQAIRKTDSQTQQLFFGLQALSRNRLLRVSAIATFLMAIATNLVDYLFKVKLQAELPAQELGPFFARFHAVSNLAILMIQLTILSPVLQRLGIKNSFRLYPGFLFTIGTLCLFYTHLWLFTMLRGLDSIMKFTFHQNTENLLMTPVPFLARTQSKVFLKGIVYPLGGLVAGLIIYLVGVTSYVLIGSLFAMLLICLLWLWAVYQTHQHYVHQLAHNLDIDFKRLKSLQNIDKEKQAVALREIDRYQETIQLSSLSSPLPPSQVEFFLLHILTLIGYQDQMNLFIQTIDTLDARQSADFIELLDQLLRQQGIYNLEGVLDHLFQPHQFAKNDTSHI